MDQTQPPGPPFSHLPSRFSARDLIPPPCHSYCGHTSPLQLLRSLWAQGQGHRWGRGSRARPLRVTTTSCLWLMWTMVLAVPTLLVPLMDQQSQRTHGCFVSQSEQRATSWGDGRGEEGLRRAELLPEILVCIYLRNTGFHTTLCKGA